MVRIPTLETVRPAASVLTVTATLALLLASTGCDKARNDSVALVNRGVMAYENGEPETAADFFRSAIARYPQNDMAYYHLALVQLYDQRDTEAARANFEEAHKLNPDNPGTAFQLGVLYLQADQLDTAQSYFQRSLKVDPSQAVVYYHLGLLLLRKKNFKEADAAFRHAIAQQPNYPPAYLELARLYLDFDEVDAAIAVLKEGIRINKSDGELYSTLGRALMTNEKYAEAVEAHKAALAIEPNRSIYLFNLGLAFQRANKPRKALELLERYVLRSEEGQDNEVQLARAVRVGIMRELDDRTRSLRDVPPSTLKPAEEATTEQPLDQ